MSTMKSICRICLCFRDPTTMFHLTDYYSDSGLSSYGESVKKFTKFITFPHEDKDLPESMCAKCLNLLQEESVLFKKMWFQSEKIINNLHYFCLSKNANLRNALTEFVMFKTILPEFLPDGYINTNSDTDHLNIYNFNEPQTSSHSECVQQESNECQENGDSEKTYNVNIVNMEEFSEPGKVPIDDSEIKIPMQKNQSSKTDVIKKRKMKRSKGVYQNWVCELCAKAFSSKARLVIHQLRLHNVGEKLECNECGHKVPDKQEMIIHLRKHTGERPYSCDKCDMTFHRRYTWKQHSLFHQEKKFKCPKCPLRFSRRSYLIIHYNTHERLYFYHCPICLINTTTLSTTRLHIFRRHGIPSKDQGSLKIIKTTCKDIPKELLESAANNK